MLYVSYFYVGGIFLKLYGGYKNWVGGGRIYKNFDFFFLLYYVSIPLTHICVNFRED